MPKFDPFDPRTWDEQPARRQSSKARRFRHTDQALEYLDMANDYIKDAHKALTDPNYFDVEDRDPAPTWDERVAVWREHLELAQAVAIAAIQSMHRAANHEDISPPPNRRRRPKGGEQPA